MDVKILYEDKAILLCIKPAGVVSEEGGMPELLRDAARARDIYCVHRLDKAAAGLMVYAKTRESAAALSSVIASGGLEKEYLAVIQGAAEAEGSMRDLLYHDASKNKTYVVKRQRRGVREAELSYQTLAQSEALSLVRIRLMTGRSHQIRVQFASRKLPLVGDRKYGSRYRDCPMALWSERLSFRHPITGELLDYRVSPPDVWPWNAFDIEKEPCLCDT